MIKKVQIVFFIALAFFFIIPSRVFADDPYGWLDYTDCDIFAGWTCDNDNYSSPIDVHFYTDNNVFVGAFTANQTRSDLAAVCGGYTNHGFWFTIPNWLKDGQAHNIWAYGINIGGGTNTLLSGSPKTISNCYLTLSGRVTNAATGGGLGGVVVNQGYDTNPGPPACFIGTQTTDASGYFSFGNITYNKGFCMRPPAAGVSGLTLNSGGYECQRAGYYANPDACGLSPSNDVAADNAYNFTYCPAAQSCPTTCHTDTQYVSNGSCGQLTCPSNAASFAVTCPTTCHTDSPTYPQGNGSCGPRTCSSNAASFEATCPTTCRTDIQYVQDASCNPTGKPCPATCGTNGTSCNANGQCVTLTTATSCGPGGTSRATGLVSTPTLGGNFNTTGACVKDLKSSFATAKIPTYEDLKADYYDKARSTSTVTKHAPIVGDANEATIDLGSNVLPETNHLYFINGNLTKGPPSFPQDASIKPVGVVFVEGNFSIQSNIGYVGGLVFVVKGNVIIDPSVTQINAIIISAEKIYTAGAACDSSSVNTGSALTINGSLISIFKDSDHPTSCISAAPPNCPLIKFCRTLSNNNDPAELINHDPKYLVILRDLYADTLERWSEEVQ